MEKLTTSSNNLQDIINWLKMGHIVCIHDDIRHLYYYSKETLTEIPIKCFLIYVDCSRYPSLLDVGEWSWYIEDAGFIRYSSTDILPTDKDNIYMFSINR